MYMHNQESLLLYTAYTYTYNIMFIGMHIGWKANMSVTVCVACLATVVPPRCRLLWQKWQAKRINVVLYIEAY